MSKYIKKIEKDYNDGKISKEEATKLKFNDIKNVFLSFKESLKSESIESFKRDVSNSNTFKNRLSFGNKVKLLSKHLKENDVLYVSKLIIYKGFVCCDNGVLLFHKYGKGIILSEGFYAYDKHFNIWHNMLLKYGFKELYFSLEKVINKEKYLETERLYNEAISKAKIEDEKKLKKLTIEKNNVISEFDKDGNGTIDLIEDKNDFNKLLKKHQKTVIEKSKDFNQNYTHQLIKVGNYIKQKRNNLQLIFVQIKNCGSTELLNEFVNILKGEIYSYNLLLINSLNLIVSLVEDDQITFYEIYERFDKLNIFSSNWENEVSTKLNSINKEVSNLNLDIKGLMYEIRDMGDRIAVSINDLSFITEESSKTLDIRLKEINSSINTNNLIALVNTYQNYKTN